MVNDDIARELQIGLFAEPGRQFAAIIRFSNAAAVAGPDIDCRGRKKSEHPALAPIATLLLPPMFERAFTPTAVLRDPALTVGPNRMK